MIDLLPSTLLLLREAAYRTRLAQVGDRRILCFEDDALMGFCAEFETAATLIEEWRNTEEGILRRYASEFLRAGEKAWNVYCIFLSSGGADEMQAREIRWIEENLERTRKLAGAAIVSRTDLRDILMPILPLQHQPAIQAESTEERLRKRFDAIAPNVGSRMFDDGATATEIAALLEALE